MEKQILNSLNITAENITKIAELFPSAVSEGKINFEILKTLLGETVDDSNERYQFSWNGKHQAMQLAQTPSTGTLLPNKEKSKNWDETDNVYIEGDNLEVLKLLQKSYFGKIKMIYIDPPYNTGKDFVYKDSFQDTIQNYKEQTNQTTKANAETSGRYHTDWLNMMYPRLMLARNLLTEDGVIFISIDDNEQANLKKMCDEIFGEDNFIAKIIHKNNSMKNQSKLMGVSTEYIFIFCKNKSFLKEILWRIEKPGTKDIVKKFEFLIKKGFKIEEIEEEIKDMYSRPKYAHLSRWNKVDERGVFKDADLSRQNGPKNYTIINPYTKNPCVIPERGWGKSHDELLRLQSENLIWYGDPNTPPGVKDYISLNSVSVPDNFWYFDNSVDTKFIKQEFNGLIFENPKPLKMIIQILTLHTGSSDIILDFFSGSSTTAHAVMQLNAEDGGKRKYIMVQIPENTPEKSEAAKAGYTTIPEIAQERIRRAGELILNDDSLPQENRDNLDTGFKVFTLDSSNVKPFNSTQLFASAETFVEGRSELDICYELILKSGLALTTPIQQRDGIYVVDEGLLFISLADQITVETADAIINLADVDLNPRVIFKDTGFSDDATKLNVLRRLQTAGISEVRSV